MAQIKTLVEKSGEQILPRTRVEAITLSDGTTNLEDFLITFEEGQLAADLNFDATSLNTSTWADVKEDIIPSTSELSLGSAAKPWKELYLSSSSLHLGDVKLSTETGSLVVASATTGDPIPVDAATLNGFTSDDFATPQYVQDQVSGLVDAAPSTLNTLNELAAALGDDANYAATVTSALGQKAPINNPTFTGTVSGISAAMVGLGNVNNTSDANKPISSAMQTALDNKLSLTGGTLSGILYTPSIHVSNSSYSRAGIRNYYYEGAISGSGGTLDLLKNTNAHDDTQFIVTVSAWHSSRTYQMFSGVFGGYPNTIINMGGQGAFTCSNYTTGDGIGHLRLSWGSLPASGTIWVNIIAFGGAPITTESAWVI